VKTNKISDTGLVVLAFAAQRGNVGCGWGECKISVGLAERAAERLRVLGLMEQRSVNDSEHMRWYITPDGRAEVAYRGLLPDPGDVWMKCLSIVEHLDAELKRAGMSETRGSIGVPEIEHPIAFAQVLQGLAHESEHGTNWWSSSYCREAWSMFRCAAGGIDKACGRPRHFYMGSPLADITRFADERIKRVAKEKAEEAARDAARKAPAQVAQ